MSENTKTFPNETDAYRSARNALLEAEKALRQQVEDVASLRRNLPLGGEPPEDYTFVDAATGESVRLSELFAPDRDALVLYSYMFSDNMEKPCPMCTAFLDALNGNADHLVQRINLAVAAKTNPERLKKYSSARGWNSLRTLSSHGTNYNRDYHGESDKGDQLPMMNVFVRRDGKIHHFWASEAFWSGVEPGGHPRHMDQMWPLWNVLDLTPEGRGTDWFPALNYD